MLELKMLSKRYVGVSERLRQFVLFNGSIRDLVSSTAVLASINRRLG